MGSVTIIDNYSDLRDIQMRVGRYKELNLEVHNLFTSLFNFLYIFFLLCNA